MPSVKTDKIIELYLERRRRVLGGWFSRMSGTSGRDVGIGVTIGVTIGGAADCGAGGIGVAGFGAGCTGAGKTGAAAAGKTGAGKTGAAAGTTGAVTGGCTGASGLVGGNMPASGSNFTGVGLGPTTGEGEDEDEVVRDGIGTIPNCASSSAFCFGSASFARAAWTTLAANFQTCGSVVDLIERSRWMVSATDAETIPMSGSPSVKPNTSYALGDEFPGSIGSKSWMVLADMAHVRSWVEQGRDHGDNRPTPIEDAC